MERRISRWLPDTSAADHSEAFEPYADDFPGFCKLLRIKTKSGGFTYFDPAIWHVEQRDFDSARTGWDLVLKPRQIGFTTLELARDVWTALKHRGVTVLIVAQAPEEAVDLFENVRRFVEDCAEAGLCAPKRKKDTDRAIVFAHNGSSIRVKEAGATDRTAQKKGRSGTIYRLHATEVAFWGAAETTMKALLNSSPQEVVIESTANGAGGTFYQSVMEAQAGRGDYLLHFYPWFRHPTYRRKGTQYGPPAPGSEEERWEAKLKELGCDAEQIQWWRGKARSTLGGGLEGALQEHPIGVNSAFRSPKGRYIAAEACDWLDRQTREPLRLLPLAWRDGRRLGTAKIFVEPRPGASYTLGGDVSEGIEGDAHAATVIDNHTMQTVATWRSNDIKPGDAGLAFAVLGTLYNLATVAPERNNTGHAAIDALEEQACYPRIYRHTDKRPGWYTTPSTRPVLFDELARGIETHAFWTPDAEVAAEARTLIKDARGKPVALRKGQKDGATDDGFVGWGIAIQARQVPQPWRSGMMPIRIPGFTT